MDMEEMVQDKLNIKNGEELSKIQIKNIEKYTKFMI